MGVSESSLKRWIDDGRLSAMRTEGRHRRIPLAEAIRFVRSHRAVLVQPEALGLPDLERVPVDLPPRDASGDHLHRLLTEGRAPDVRGFLLHLFVTGMSVAELADGPLREALARIGELWKHSPEGVLIEHQAMDICLQAVNQIRLLIDPPVNGPRAVGAAPSGDPYLLPSLLAACVLGEVGYVATNLGPNTPAETLLRAAERESARLCWLSVSAPRDGLELMAMVEDLARHLHERGSVLAVGGHALPTAGMPSPPNARLGSSMADLESLAIELRPAA